MNVLALGGSNTRMIAGYTKWLREELQAMESAPLVFDNLALGANTCLLGIVSLLEHHAAREYDLIVIEYSVNDYAMVASNDLDLWRASFEGLIRMVSLRWPRARTCCLMLGRSNVDETLWERQMAETRHIAAHYPAVLLADAQAKLRQSGVPELEIYADPMHFAPAAQQAAGRMVAELVRNAAPLNPSPLPARLHPHALDNVGAMDLSAFALDGQAREFSNSVVQVRATTMRLGDRLRVDVPGVPVCVVFVSTPGCGSFLMSSGDDHALVHTLHDGVRDGKFPFLPLSAYGRWWKYSPGPRSVSFEALPFTDRPADWPTFHVVPSSEAQPVVHLSKLLFRGAGGN
jgi:hypothetical protein